MEHKIRISSGIDLVEVLQDKPVQWAQIIAARVALRVLPITGRVLDASFENFDQAHKEKFTLQSCRAAQISLIACCYPTHDLTKFTLDAYQSISKCFGEPFETAFFRAAHSAAYATTTFSASKTPAATAATGVATSATSATGAITSVTSVTDRTIVDAINWDLKALEEGMKSEQLASQPLWTRGIPQWFAQERLAFDGGMQELGGDWSIWSDWLGRRMAGERTAGLPDEMVEELDVRVAKQSENWWNRNPEEINTDIARWFNDALGIVQPLHKVEEHKPLLSEFDTPVELDEELTQSSAPFSYAVRDGKLHALPQTDEPLDAATVEDILSELIEKAREHTERLARSSNIAPRLKRSADRLVVTLEQWTETPKPGVLLMRLRSFEADVNAYDTPQGWEELYPDAIAGMYDIAKSLDDFLSLYPIAQKMQAAALALKIQRADIDEINVNIETIRSVTEKMEEFDDSVPASLAEGQADYEEATLAVELTTDEVKKAEAIEKRAETTAYQVLNARNFCRAVVAAAQSGTLKGIESFTSSAIKTGGAVAIWIALADPVITLGVYLATFLPLGKRIKQIANPDEDEITEV